MLEELMPRSATGKLVLFACILIGAVYLALPTRVEDPDDARYADMEETS
jgi:hypothetical protein